MTPYELIWVAMTDYGIVAHSGKTHQQAWKIMEHCEFCDDSLWQSIIVGVDASGTL